MVPRRAAAFVIAFSFLVAPLTAQTPAYDKAKESLRESLKRPTVTDRLVGIREIADTKDVRAADDLVAAVRVQEKVIEKKREEIERLGKENREIWKQVDDAIGHQRDQGVKEPKISVELANRVTKQAAILQEKLKPLTADLTTAEATRSALHEGIGRLLLAADPAARASKTLELASAAQKVTSFDDKLVFIRIFGAIRTPESRDALIEMARLNPDGQVRTAAVTALGDLEDPTAIPTLGEALKDEVWSVKAAAAHAIAIVPTVDGVPALAEALGKNEGGTGDAIVKALEDITGVTFFDNGTLWAEWFKKEGQDIKAALADLDSGEPSIRIAAMNTIATKGTLAGVRMLLRHEGLDPARDTRAKFKISGLGAAETRPAANDEVEARRAAIGRALVSRPKQIRDRAIASLILEPAARADDVDDDQLQAAYLRAASSTGHRSVLDMLTRYAKHVPQGDKAQVEERVRRAAIEALGWQNQDDAVVALGEIVKADKTSKESKEIGISALERLRRQACVTPLIDLLLEKGPIAEAAARALRALTGADHGVDRKAWHTWWNTDGKTTAQLAKKKDDETADDDDKEGGEKRGTSFYGITTRSKRLLYVLDISGSMNEENAPGSTGGAGGTKIQRAKKELKASVTALPEDALFNIIVFADGVQVWKPKFLTATKDVKAETLKWVDAINAIGATNIFDALEKAFELAGRGATDKRYNLAVDTIMFMSDGQPNRGRIVDRKAILAEVSRMNEHKKVTIHAIGVGKDHDVELMKRLARLNGGTYVAK